MAVGSAGDEGSGLAQADSSCGYDESGVDRSLVRWMLSLSPTERLAYLQGSIDLVSSVRDVDGRDR